MSGIFFDSPAETLAEMFLIGSLDICNGLSNGDEIAYEWSCSAEELENMTGIKFKCNSVKYKIKGLEDINTFDAFEGVNVEFSGVAPNGTAELVIEPTEVTSRLTYYFNKMSNISEGENVIVSISEETPEYYLEEFGAVPKEFKKTFTAELGKYISEKEDLTDKVVSKWDDYAQNLLKEYVKEEWSVPESLAGMTLMEAHLFVPTEDTLVSTVENCLYLVYKIDVKLDEEKFFYYYYTGYDNVSLLPNGDSDMEKYSVPESYYSAWNGKRRGDYFYHGIYMYEGFEEYTDLEKSVFEPLKEYYSSIDLIISPLPTPTPCQ